MEKYLSPEGSTEEITGDGDQVRLNGTDAETDWSATWIYISNPPCTKCKTSPIATATATVAVDVNQSESVTSMGSRSSMVSAIWSDAVVEFHRTLFAPTVGFFALGWIL